MTNEKAAVPPADGLRQRNVTEPETERPVETASRPETRQNDQNHTVEMQNYFSSFVNNYGRIPPYPNYNFSERYLQAPNDPAMFANHMMMMQQAYLQYMQQYANMRQAGEREAEAVPEAAAAAAPAEAREAAGEELAARDWLDHVYAASRLAILFSLVYLYGSPARLLLVLLLAIAAYLHQIGFFRDLHVPPNNTPAEANTEESAPTRQSLLTSTWIIVTSFFASLIPDTN
ncbi:unnamed protein product [Parnassius apollo]|uniref:(apollo) hypothetical protein n=1 Tax=Parnassius apollo TaxID=110799 RepID=A0A8S3X1G2_PARAO|nr:unnamed protein product [Parnassius apollo]